MTSNNRYDGIQYDSSNRKLSLFKNSSIASIKNKLSQLNKPGVEEKHDNNNYSNIQTDQIRMSGSMIRRNTAADLTSAGAICQRCKRFEVDLTTTSDNLNATDAELKASRQVISLLQRQLELFQVEKEGLEKLVVSQSKSPSKVMSSSKEDDSINETFSDIENHSPNKEQQNVLELIKTQLYVKDEEIVKLKSSLKETRNETEQLRLQMHMLEDDVSSLRNENVLLKENLALRDHTIVQLSSELFEQSNPGSKPDHRRQSSAEILSNRSNSISQQKQVADLSDTLEAYKKTNELLSTNVVQLTEKLSQSERKEIDLRSQCQEFEAKCCQIQSKLLSLLREIEQSSKSSISVDDSNGQNDEQVEIEVIRSESVKLLIKRLLEDKSLDIPLSWKEGNSSRQAASGKLIGTKIIDCDELGFYTTTSSDAYQHAMSPLSSSGTTSPINSRNFRASRVLKRGMSGFSSPSHLATVGEEPTTEQTTKNSSYKQHRGSVDSAKKDEASWRSKWDDFIKNFDQIDLNKSKEFKQLLRCGVPQDYRCKVWKAIIDLKIGKERQQYGVDYYQSLLEPNNVKQKQANRSTMQSPSSKQIELDLLRTLPNNRYFETIDSSGTVRLRRVLLAFSAHKPQVGYCQGMNRLAAVALLVLPEEEAFWCLVVIVDKIMPVGYYNDLWLAQVDSGVVMELVAAKMPQLNEHFKRNGIELSLFAFFLTIFVDGTPPALFLRLWDCFLYEGDKILFRAALAILKKNESELLKINNSVTANNFIRSTVSLPMDIDHFLEIAFEWANPLPSRALRQKREQNFQAMRSSFSVTHQSTTRYSINETYRDDSDDKNGDKDDSLKEESSIISV